MSEGECFIGRSNHSTPPPKDLVREALPYHRLFKRLSRKGWIASGGGEPTTCGADAASQNRTDSAKVKPPEPAGHALTRQRLEDTTSHSSVLIAPNPAPTNIPIPAPTPAPRAM